MYLSQLHVATDHPHARAWLGNRYRIHQRLWMAFAAPPEPDFLRPFEPHAGEYDVPRSPGTRFLFRVDTAPAGRVSILVQSESLPDWEAAFANAPSLLIGKPQPPVHLDPMLAAGVSAGRLLRFRLRANVTHSVRDPERLPNGKPSSSGHQRGKRVPLLAVGEQFDWLTRQLASAGAALEIPSFETPEFEQAWKQQIVCHEGLVPCSRRKDGPAMILNSALFNGILRVERPSDLLKAVRAGIGPGKAFGFGLLSLAGV